MTFDSRVHAWVGGGGRGARGQNLVHLQNIVFLSKTLKFLAVHSLTATYPKAFILGPWVPCRVGFHSMTTDFFIYMNIRYLSKVFECCHKLGKMQCLII